jgi:maltooligosyltrehalose trehalohydrolase
MRAAHLHAMPFGASVLADGRVRFRLFAPSAKRVTLLYDTGAEALFESLALADDGVYETVVPATAGTTYRFDVDGLIVPDPASRFQPEGVHGPSLVVDPAAFDWPATTWHGRPWHEHVFYELHVGTFTPEGSYAGAETKLDYLADLGITALELMPLADVPGARNWGYDGVLPYAPSHNYGRPDDLRRFVAAAHARELAVYLDVVYNHFGPEGNYLHAYAPEFYTEGHRTPWGAALDLESDGRQSVRDFFIENAIYWLDEYRFDGLRLDAVHAIYDGPRRRFLRELAARVHARIGRTVHLVLENEENESALLEGAAYRAQWNDDAHHAAHVVLTGQADGYYSDYASDPVARFGRTLTQGFAYQGEPSRFREGRPRGEMSSHLPLGSFVTFLQNHDQIGNRPFGDRIATLAPEDAVRAVLAALMLAPSPPLLFMGEEWAASTPFLFFCDFEPELAAKVTEGRRAEFGAFAEFADPAARARIPDPAAPATFVASTLRWDELEGEPHRSRLAYYRRLLAIRRDFVAPHVPHLRVGGATFERVGAAGLRAHFPLDDGGALVLDANLGPAALPWSFASAGDLVFATNATAFADGVAKPWSARWSTC